MGQPVKRREIATKDKRTRHKIRSKPFKKHPKYEMSKLEDKFAKEFLDRLGIEYIRQYEAKDICRFYDFYLPKQNLLIEIDGDYYHAYNKMYEQMSPMQKRNHRVDEVKNKWAAEHCFVLLRIWEHEINDTPAKVMEVLERELDNGSEKKRIRENKRKRH